MYYTRQELLDAVEELERARHTIQNCEKLSSIYSVLDHLYPGWNNEAESERYIYGYSAEQSKQEKTIADYSDSEFLKLISGKDEKRVLNLLNELVEAVSALEPRLYDSMMRKLKDI